jgi:septation ring formation regulator EzrA
LAELQQLYRDLSTLENDLRDAGENLDEVRQQKQIVWADMAARNLVAGPEEILFYKIGNALTYGELTVLCLTIPDVCHDQETANELLHAVEQRKEQFAANARAIKNN